MITEEQITKKLCLFCVSDYHLEMILLPYIKERIEDSNFIIFTQNDLKKSLEILLDKINLNQNIKNKIKSINWNKEDNTKFKILNEINKNLIVIINGDKDYINYINNKIEEFEKKDLQIIHCYHVEDNIDISKIKSKYKYIMNTKKI